MEVKPCKHRWESTGLDILNSKHYSYQCARCGERISSFDSAACPEATIEMNFHPKGAGLITLSESSR